MLPLHAVWRPGVGLGVWRDASSRPPGESDPADTAGESGSGNGADAPTTDDLPAGIAEMLAGRRFRRRLPVIDEFGGRTFVDALTLGTPSAVAFLDLTRSTPVSGEIAWYRHLLDGIRRMVAAGAVAPGVASVAGEPTLRWHTIPTPPWRTWLSVMAASAPGVAETNGGAAALADLTAELVDHETRARLRVGGRQIGTQPPLIAALLPDAPQDLPIAVDRVASATAAWTSWNTGVPEPDSALVLRLFEPDDGTGGLDADADDLEPFDADALRWRLQVCRRSADGHIEPVAPHRLDPHELDQITSGLADAHRAFPELGQAEPDHANLDYLLDTRLVGALFDSGAAALTAAGIAMLLPRTIAEVRPTLHLRARPVATSTARAALVGLAEIRDFEWRLALGDGPGAVELTEADLEELARQRGDLIRLRGVWVRAEGAALSRAAAFVTAQRAASTTDQPADMGELFGLLTDGADRVPVPVTSVKGLDWLDQIAESGTLRPESTPVPALLDVELRPYQQRGLDWLAYLSRIGIGGVLADDMGLGKTVQVIALLCHERAGDAPRREPTLIVCPMSVVGNWEREIARFAADLRVLVHHGPARNSRAGFGSARADADVVITTFAIATRDRELLSAHRWERIVVDEAQHLKNVATAAAKAVRAIPARHRVALTGTPVENRLEDLRAVIDLVNPGMLGSASGFRARYAEPIERDRDPQAVRRLSAITRPFVLRREKTDPAILADLPEKSEMTVRVNLTVEQAALYRAIIDELMAALRDSRQRVLRRRTVLAALTRLKQICNHPAHYLADGSPLVKRGAHRSGKVELLADMVTTSIDEGDRVLVFTQFAAFGELLAEWLTDELATPVPLLHGGVGRPDRDRMVADFQRDDGPPVMLATLKAGGTGLNLTAANHVVHVDRWWNPAVEDQATDRAYRIGQTRRVQVSRFVCVGTIEERIDDMIAAKRELSRLTVDAGESWLADLGDEALLDLFRLRDEAVSE
ncbi:DEAD/DEAH box helicase [Gordonia soli]|uniref:Putative helicase n=1 Tax=Gordonia soli NBRC 108243 TaxID=1223545 RepID=M0QG92_9ACTN|nr:putative helicase [Gordonia soli NBRC 108243]